MGDLDVKRGVLIMQKYVTEDSGTVDIRNFADDNFKSIVVNKTV